MGSVLEHLAPKASTLTTTGAETLFGITTHKCQFFQTNKWTYSPGSHVRTFNIQWAKSYVGALGSKWVIIYDIYHLMTCLWDNNPK